MTRISMSDVVNSVVGEQLWLPASAFTKVGGAVTYDQVGAVSSRRSPAWLFTDPTEQSIAVILDLQSGWATVDLFAVWVNPNAGVGDVVWRADYGNLFELQSIDSETVGSTTTVTASAQWQVTLTQLANDITFNPSGLNRLEIGRLGNNAADTLTGNAALLGAFLRKTPVPSNWLRE